MNTTNPDLKPGTGALRGDLRPSGTSPRSIPFPQKHPDGRFGGHQ